MRIELLHKVVHTLFIIAVLFNMNNIVFAQSPYAMFGDKSVVLDATAEPICNIYCVKIKEDDMIKYLLNFDFEKGIATLRDLAGIVIRQDSISENAKAMFTILDPHAESYYGFSPYNYCGGNPMNRIDLTGMDWYQNNETSDYTWFDGDASRDGFTYIGGKGSVLGEFEGIIDNILCGEDGLGMESLYSEGFTFDIAPIDKGCLIRSEERGVSFLEEFISGSGAEFSVLLAGHPYTDVVMNEDFVKECQNIIRSRGENGKYTNVGRPEFFPWQASPISPMQYVGTYRYDGYSSKDGQYINNVVTDSKSVTSLGYHIPFLNNHRRSQGRKFGNTYQFYIKRVRK